MTPEAKAREVIDQKLRDAGWTIQDLKQFNPLASCGVAVREFPTTSGPVDYVLFVNRKPVGVIEAKASTLGETLTVAEMQSRRYATSQVRWGQQSFPIRFAYEATDILTRFTDYADEKARAREVFSFFRPETLVEWLSDSSTLRNRMRHFPDFDSTGFRDCQIRAILNLEQSFSQAKPRALIQMATGAGKTFTAITSVYRLLKHANAKRILFLVDTRNLGEQAESEFLRYKPSDDARLFPELYTVRRLNSGYIPTDTKVCISTIQRMYSILRGEEMDESLEETSPNEYTITGSPREVVYNPSYPPEFFDFIVIDECHRSIYNTWQQVLDYFDAFFIGLTATPDQRTFAFFHENVVSEYTHEQAVIDGVNVSGDIYTIETDITRRGAVILQQSIERRDRLTHKRRWEQLDEEVNYSGTQLDRDVVNPSQIRAIIKAFRDKLLTEIFQERKEVPKTLIFAKTDSHAEDIIQIVREEFGEGNEFCQKITYQAEQPKTVLANFRNGYYPRIAVTVDMIATGTDVKPIECLLFMRDVRSRNYFEQMKGRGTRVLSKDDLQNVSPSATDAKARYVLIDAVGVTRTLKTDSRPLERKPTVPLKDLMMSVAMQDRDEDTLTTLAGRLTRLDVRMTDNERKRFAEINGGKPIRAVVQELLDAFDGDVIESYARKNLEIPTDQDVSPEQMDEAHTALAEAACLPFYNPQVRDYVENVRKSHDQIIDNVNLDHVNYAGWGEQQAARAAELTDSFRAFIEAHKDEIAALGIIYSRSYRTRALTLNMVQELHDILRQHGLVPERVWDSFGIVSPKQVQPRSVVKQLADIVSLVRFALGQVDRLAPFADTVDFNFMRWTMAKNAGHIHFSAEQMVWLRMIKDHVACSLSIEEGDLEYTPFDARGGLGRFYELFRAEYLDILREMNEVLVG